MGLKYGTMQDRRRKHGHFASAWAAAVVAAQARLLRRDLRPTSKASQRPLSPTPPPRRGEGLAGTGFRTLGGESVVVRLKNGMLQVRRAQVGKLTPEAEQAFFAALSATCNVTLAAAAVGACFGAFNRRRRKDPAFAREMLMALQRGFDGLEMALLESGLPASHEHDDWRHNDPPAIPPMTASQALQLMYLHQKQARLTAVPDRLRRRAREPEEAYYERLVQMSEERLRLEQEKFEVAEAERRERGEPAWGPAGEAVRLAQDERLRQAEDEREAGFGLPDLAQVTGWSRADPDKAPHHPGLALFGGWRMEDMERKLRG
jgi:hypothetical protein